MSFLNRSSWTSGYVYTYTKFTQMSGNKLDSNSPTDEGGRPQSDITELTDSGEQSSEQSSDWG